MDIYFAPGGVLTQDGEEAGQKKGRRAWYLWNTGDVVHHAITFFSEEKCREVTAKAQMGIDAVANEIQASSAAVPVKSPDGFYWLALYADDLVSGYLQEPCIVRAWRAPHVDALTGPDGRGEIIVTRLPIQKRS